MRDKSSRPPTRLNGPIVRRVPTPEEEAAEKAKKDAELAARQQAQAEARARRAASPQKQTSPRKKRKHH